MKYLILVLVVVVIALHSRSLPSKATHSPAIQRNMSNMDVSLDNASQPVLGSDGQEHKTLQTLLLSPKTISPLTTNKPPDKVQHASSITTTTQNEKERDQAPTMGQESVHKSLNLSSENLTNCIVEDGHLYFASTEGLLTLILKTRPPLAAHEHACHVTVTAPVDHVFYTEIMFFDIVALIVFDEGANPPRKLFDTTNMSKFDGPPESVANKVTFQYKLSDGLNIPIHMQLSFVAVPSSEEPHLEVIMNRTAPLAGYIQIPGFDGTSHHPLRMDSWARVDVPQGHVVMLSFSHIDMDDEEMCTHHTCNTAQLYQISNLTKHQVWNRHYLKSFPPTVLTAHAVEVHTYTDSIYRHATGFRLMFSLHNRSETPRKLPYDKWNCSVPYWADFKQHFPCNLVPDCDGGEDEVDCPYATRMCGPGYVTAGGSCFLYVSIPPDVSMSWNDASNECQRRGLQLASLNTPAKWDDVTRLLEMRREFYSSGKPQEIYIGLRSVHPSVPIMYQSTYQWTDGTIAYYIQQNVLSSDIPPECARLDLWSHPYELYFKLRPCHQPQLNLREYAPSRTPSRLQPKDAFISSNQPTDCDVFSFMFFPPNGLSETLGSSCNFLCEKKTSNGRRNIRLPIPETRLTTETFVTCPKNHTTHNFLACDVKSDCWGNGYGPSYTCDSQMTPLPPSLTCASGMEFVPYTLVCDHRPDCGDGSDEEFCVFPPCDRLLGQCVLTDSWCDGVEHCVNGADEQHMFSKVVTLNLSGTGVDRVLGVGLQSMPQLRVLDLRGCPMTVIPRTLFHGLDKLHMVYADHFTICCQDVLPPGFNSRQFLKAVTTQFGVTIWLNFFLFSLVGIGQLFIQRLERMRRERYQRMQKNIMARIQNKHIACGGGSNNLNFTSEEALILCKRWLKSGVLSAAKRQLQSPSYRRHVQPPFVHRQVQPALYRRQVQPPFYRRQVQPPFYRRQVQPPFYRRQVQPPFYRRQVQPPLYRRQVQPSLYRRQVHPPFYRRQVQPPFYRRQVQPPFYRRQVQPPFYRRQVQPPFYRRQVQPPLYRRQVQPPFYRRQVQPPLYRRQVQPPSYRCQLRAKKKLQEAIRHTGTVLLTGIQTSVTHQGAGVQTVLVTIFEYVETSERLYMCQMCETTPASGLYSLTSRVHFHVYEYSHVVAPFWVRINVTVVPESERPQLEVIFVSPTYEGTTEDHIVWDAGRYDSPAPRVLNTSVLHVHFTSEVQKYGTTGFRLHFSFHNHSFLPQQMTDGRWNCSVPHWTDFQQHFPCNLVSDCDGGQDEAACPYSSTHCGQGRLTAGGKCFLYVTSQRFITWEEAANECLRRDGHLASLNTPEEWRDVISLLKLPHPYYVYIGLHSSSMGLPRM
ncbi:hypothetical protein BaRGS_00019951 [Batillaria attramentaria]|uniref:C-type lectin domain-containing protein n=1 Tax=Batillaria attramentaria TaxID=370345 RepID=A0ABD0KNL8_9CAEN